MSFNFNDAYPFQVSTWHPGTVPVRAPYDRACWVEQCRCRTRERAVRIARQLFISDRGGIQVAELVTDANGAQFIGFLFLPASAGELHE